MYTRPLAISLFIGVLAGSSALAAYAQDTNTTTDRTIAAKVDKVERGFDWGWLGLLGLAGLMGLRPRHDKVEYAPRSKV
jgi:hypothetical protein